MDKSQFQTFDEVSDAATCAPRLAALRAELAKRGLDGFLVPHSDEHQGEYLPPRAERLAWLTAFTGSAGRGGGADGQGGDLRRRALHAAGAPPDRHEPVRAARSRHRRTGRLDRGQCAEGHQARLRPLAAHPGRARTFEARRREGGRDAGGRREQSDRCGVARSAGPARRQSRCRTPSTLRAKLRKPNAPASPKR